MGTIAAATLTPGVENNKRVVECVVTGSASYATGGDTIPLTTIGLYEIHAVEQPSHRSNGANFAGEGDAVSNAQAQTGYSVQLGGTVRVPKLKFYNVANTEIANATDLSAVSVVVRFIGL